ncbi:V-set and immunoglobulin domain-containing protein 1, partial [Rhinatrema bivittatum]|uniref:V-set and immunoglobulin domain-containing protein 1 n=1 Tax=Rhinatrema bivittatum TaxID=194408 RepID=UPI00112939E2
TEETVTATNKRKFPSLHYTIIKKWISLSSKAIEDTALCTQLVIHLNHGLSIAVQVTVPQISINAPIGQNATLQCTYSSSSPLTNVAIQWLFHKNLAINYTTVYYSGKGFSEAFGNFKGRVTNATNPENASITISNLQSEDSGLYMCDVTNPPDFSGNNIGKVQLIVTVPPSTPHCSIRGAVETGHYITLECFSRDGVPPPTYQWNKVVGAELKPTPPEMNSNTGELIIGNLSTFETGHYRCTATNSLGNATCELDLSTGAGEGIIAAAIIGALLLAAIICAIVIFLTVKLKKSKKEKFAATEMKAVNQTQQESSPMYGSGAAEQREPASESLLAAQPETKDYTGHTYEGQHAEHVTSAVIENGEMEGEEAPAMA